MNRNPPQRDYCRETLEGSNNGEGLFDRLCDVKTNADGAFVAVACIYSKSYGLIAPGCRCDVAPDDVARLLACGAIRRVDAEGK